MRIRLHKRRLTPRSMASALRGTARLASARVSRAGAHAKRPWGPIRFFDRTCVTFPFAEYVDCALRHVRPDHRT